MITANSKLIFIWWLLFEFHLSIWTEFSTQIPSNLFNISSIFHITSSSSYSSYFLNCDISTVTLIEKNLENFLYTISWSTIIVQSENHLFPEIRIWPIILSNLLCDVYWGKSISVYISSNNIMDSLAYRMKTKIIAR